MMLFETVFQDLRYGARALFRNAGFTAVSVFALALGIGVNTTVFTAYKALIARPLDARDPGSMVNFALRLQTGANVATFSYPDYKAYRDQLHSFSGVIAVYLDELKLTDAGGIVSQRSSQGGSLMGRLGLLRPGASNAEFASAFIVSENYFSVLGVSALRGRTFESISPSDLAASPSVLISENYWQRRFGGAPATVGRSIRLNGAPFTIVGITPHNFVGTSIALPDFWLPLSLSRSVHPESQRIRDREDLCCRLFGRLKAGVSMSVAQAETTLLASHLRALHDPHSDLSKDVTAFLSPGSPLPGQMNANLRLTILVIMLAVGMVLVIACANAASLQLARATTRQQELGMRMSLGASRPRLIRQLLTESALMGSVAGCIALPATWILLRLAVTAAVGALPFEWTLVLNVNPDPEIFGYVFTISVVAGILFGLAPAIESSRSALLSVVRGMGGSPVRSWLRHLLIAAQVAVSLALMIAGSMLIRSAIHALRMGTGYDGDRVIEVSLQFPEESKYTAEHKKLLVRDLRSRLAALPGAADVTSAHAPDDNGSRRASVSLNLQPPSARNLRATLYYTWVQANYFRTLGVPMKLGGGGFAAEAGSAGQSVIVSESAARRLWPGENPVGRSLRLGTDGQFHNKSELLPDGPAWRVIGVARDTRGVALDGSDSEQVYVPLPSDRLQDYPILVRTRSDPKLMTSAIDQAISAADPELVGSASTLQEMLRQTDAFLIDSLSAAIASAISLFGLLLASMGIYSTISYIVVLRTREVGIRMAIGAQKRDILFLMMRETARPVIAGLLVGMILAASSSQLLRGVLYGLNTVDGVSFVGASVLFVAIAMIATWLPSRRAVRIDPVVTLRYQ